MIGCNTSRAVSIALLPCFVQVANILTLGLGLHLLPKATAPQSESSSDLPLVCVVTGWCTWRFLVPTSQSRARTAVGSPSFKFDCTTSNMSLMFSKRFAFSYKINGPCKALQKPTLHKSHSMSQGQDTIIAWARVVSSVYIELYIV